MMGSRVARAFMATYAVILHLFIMVLIYSSMSPRTKIEVVDLATVTQHKTAG